MAIKVRGIDREQWFLMPPSVADWLPENHTAGVLLPGLGAVGVWAVGRRRGSHA